MTFGGCAVQGCLSSSHIDSSVRKSTDFRAAKTRIEMPDRPSGSPAFTVRHSVVLPNLNEKSDPAGQSVATYSRSPHKYEKLDIQPTHKTTANPNNSKDDAHHGIPSTQKTHE